MAIDLATVERLAPDQSALKAAAGLAKPGKWSGLGGAADGRLIWGECAGSGANPYRVVADLEDHGNKCSCPSRKFPCKHVLALFWLSATAGAAFPVADVPEWVGDWLGRRRKIGGAPAPVAAAPKDIATAEQATPATVEDPRAAERREAATARRAEDTDRAIAEALDALEQWIGDQLRLGLAAFLDDATARCRRIAARLVDGKASTLAGRIDELPSRLLALPAGDRTRSAVVELGRLVCLARAWRSDPRDPELRRAIGSAESREAVLADPDAIRVTTLWEVLAEQVQTRRDGLVAQTTWLLALGGDTPRFAMLVDYFPASAGRRGSVFAPGEQFAGEVVFYPSRTPLRALLASREPLPVDERHAWPAADDDITVALAAVQLAEPWRLDTPVLLPAGRIGFDPAGKAWWRAGTGTALPLAGTPAAAIAGMRLDSAAALWSTGRLELLAAQTGWGRIDAHG
ncbi:MAG: SWIM zinc finger family protein [Alphaproteobacteria bacterium]|nr:MAG: SWIM zinc finger family protein [Alphaproteobacteria bacterium]